MITLAFLLQCNTGAVQLTVICYSTRPVTVWSLPFLCHTHHPNVVGGASLQCSQDGGVTADSRHLQGPFWWGVHLPWLSGILDSVGHSSTSKSLPRYSQSWRSALHTRSGPYTESATCMRMSGIILFLLYSTCILQGHCDKNFSMVSY